MREFINSILQGSGAFWLFMLAVFIFVAAALKCAFEWGRSKKASPPITDPAFRKFYDNKLNFCYPDPESLEEWRALQELQASSQHPSTHHRSGE